MGKERMAKIWGKYAQLKRQNFLFPNSTTNIHFVHGMRSQGSAIKLGQELGQIVLFSVL